jgi:outer membrane biosynthesis protein TonB
VSRRRRLPGSTGLGLAGTALVHGLAGVMLFGNTTRHRPAPPVYKVQLVAAPEPGAETRKAPEAVERPAAEQPAPALKPKPQPKSTVSRATPPPAPDATHREAAPRTTPKAAPLPGEKPSTGSDEVTVSTEGVEFPYPEYLQNAMTQILRRWQRPFQNALLEAEVSFFIHRDGSITDLQFVKRSGNFGFDLEAEGAVEEAGRFRAFGQLPAGWKSDVLFVRFFFAPPGQRQ